MAVKYGNQYVDENYAKAIEPNLYTDTVLIHIQSSLKEKQ